MTERSKVRFEGRSVNGQGEVEILGQACHSTTREGLREMSLPNGKVRDDTYQRHEHAYRRRLRAHTAARS